MFVIYLPHKHKSIRGFTIGGCKYDTGTKVHLRRVTFTPELVSCLDTVAERSELCKQESLPQ